MYFPKLYEIHMPISYCRYVGRPIARCYGLKEGKGPAPSVNPILESIYKSNPSKRTQPKESVANVSRNCTDILYVVTLP